MLDWGAIRVPSRPPRGKGPRRHNAAAFAAKACTYEAGRTNVPTRWPSLAAAPASPRATAPGKKHVAPEDVSTIGKCALPPPLPRPIGRSTS